MYGQMFWYVRRPVPGYFSKIFQKFLKTFLKFPHILKFSQKFLKNFSKLSQKLQNCSKLSQNFPISQNLLSLLESFSKISRNFLKSWTISQKFLESFSKISQNFLKSCDHFTCKWNSRAAMTMHDKAIFHPLTWSKHFNRAVTVWNNKTWIE